MTLDTLLSTKLYLPVARANLVPRPRLLERLTQGLRSGHRLTLVCAPPGFGKTTLICAWTGVIGRRIAWLSLDAGDGDPAGFVRYLMAAVNRADERVGRAYLAPAATLAPRDLLIRLINEVAETGTELVLVLDDYHLIREFAVHDLVAFLVANAPPNLHVVIGTREDPPLPLARWRARDQMTEIREGALRFRAGEAGAFFAQTMQLDVSPASLAALMARTEGWITGLQLVGLALRQQSAAEEFVAAFTRDDHFLLDYLMAEVLAGQPATVRSFVRQTSILERLSAPLCDALTGRHDAMAMLEHLENANLFLVPLDSRREWYRYHVIFAEVLRLTLTAQEQIELHTRAIDWYETHGAGDLAQRHVRLLDALPAGAGATARRGAAQGLVEPLSERELEVLQLIAEGYANAEIGQRLCIAVGTVKRHINNIFGKLDVASRTQAVAKARTLKLIK